MPSLSTLRSGSLARLPTPVPDRLPDEALVELARRGSTQAEEALYRRHAPAVTTTVFRLLGQTDEARDVIQDTFVAALEELHALREPARVRSWLMQIAVSKVHRRFRRRRMLGILGFGSWVHEEPDLSSPASRGAGPDERTELALIDRALTELPARERIAWILRHVEERSLAEVADSCQCSLATAKRSIASAERRIENHIRGDHHA